MILIVCLIALGVLVYMDKIAIKFDTIVVPLSEEMEDYDKEQADSYLDLLRSGIPDSEVADLEEVLNDPEHKGLLSGRLKALQVKFFSWGLAIFPKFSIGVMVK